MAYEVIARKWRPQQFSDVIGQEHVTGTLGNAIESERVAHAYLFVGPRGTGKTTTARILAKALNCEKGSSTQPCDKCDACREIMAGNSLDVLEIDGASNNGVDQVRDLRQNVQYAPARGPYKIYIIDEVHMLSTAAFNALLKTLEEPPSHVKFMFATTEPQKVPSTILSRCQRFDLRRIPIRAIVGRLRHIVDAEKLSVDDSALLAIARGAEGGMRDAQSALDQLISFRGEQITEADVLSVFGLVSWQALESLASSTLQGDVPGAMRLIGDLDREGKDLQRVVVELLDHFRNLLVCLYSSDALDEADLADTQVAAVKAQAEGLEAGRILRVVEILTEAEGRMRFALSRRTLMETAVIRAARASTVVSIDELIRRVEALGAGDGEAAPVAAAPQAAPAPTQRPAAAPVKKKVVVGEALASVQSEWGALVQEIGKRAKLAVSFLKSVQPVSVDEAGVLLGYAPAAKSDAPSDMSRLMKGATRVLSEHLGRNVAVTFEPRDDMTEAGPPPSGEPSTTGIPQPSPPPGPSDGATFETRESWMHHPAVQKTLEIFSGDIVDIRD